MCALPVTSINSVLPAEYKKRNEISSLPDLPPKKWPRFDSDTPQQRIENAVARKEAKGEFFDPLKIPNNPKYFNFDDPNIPYHLLLPPLQGTSRDKRHATLKYDLVHQAHETGTQVTRIGAPSPDATVSYNVHTAFNSVPPAILDKNFVAKPPQYITNMRQAFMDLGGLVGQKNHPLTAIIPLMSSALRGVNVPMLHGVPIKSYSTPTPSETGYTERADAFRNDITRFSGVPGRGEQIVTVDDRNVRDYGAGSLPYQASSTVSAAAVFPHSGAARFYYPVLDMQSPTKQWKNHPLPGDRDRLRAREGLRPSLLHD